MVRVDVDAGRSRRRLAKLVGGHKTAGMQGERALLVALIAGAAQDALSDDRLTRAAALEWFSGAPAAVEYRHALSALDLPTEWLPRGLALVDGNANGNGNANANGQRAPGAGGNVDDAQTTS